MTGPAGSGVIGARPLGGVTVICLLSTDQEVSYCHVFFFLSTPF